MPISGTPIGRETPRDRQHRPVAAEHDGQVDGLSQVLRRGRRIAGQRRVARGFAFEDDGVARGRPGSSRGAPAAPRGPDSHSGRRGRRGERRVRRRQRTWSRLNHSAAAARPSAESANRDGAARGPVAGVRIDRHAGTARAAPPEDADRALYRRRAAGRLARAVAPFGARAVAGDDPQRDGGPGGDGLHQQPAHVRRPRAHAARAIASSSTA